MKKILIAGVLAAVAASPALAASKQARNNNLQATSRSYTTAEAAYAYSPASQFVVLNGQVLGADPDPFIRGQIERLGDPANLNN
jgi:opacity protein-like surface antigen